MADAYGEWAGTSQKWRCHMSYGIGTENSSDAQVYVTARFETKEFGYNMLGNVTCSISGSSPETKNDVKLYSPVGGSVDTDLQTTTFVVSKGSSEQQIELYASISTVESSGAETGVSKVTALLTVPAKVNEKNPDAPTNVKAVYDGKDKVTLTWTNNPGQGVVRTNLIRYRYNDNGWNTFGSTTGSDVATFTGTVEPNRKYEFCVNSHSYGGRSNFSDVTTPIYTVPPAPRGLSVTRVDKTVYGTADVSNVAYPGKVSWAFSPDNQTWVDLNEEGKSVTFSLVEAADGYYMCQVASQDTTKLTVSEWSAKKQSSPIARIYVNVPDGKSIQGIYIQKP